MSKKYRELPAVLRAILFDCDAYLVGSGAKWYTLDSEERPKDFDVIVAPEDWNKASRMIGCTDLFDRLNSLGGFKVGGDDIWMSTLNEYMKSALGRGDSDMMVVGINPNCTMMIYSK